MSKRYLMIAAFVFMLICMSLPAHASDPRCPPRQQSFHSGCSKADALSHHSTKFKRTHKAHMRRCH